MALRRNSVESLKDDSSSVSSGSIDGSDEESSDEDNLITVLKKQTFLKAKKPLVTEPWCRKVSKEESRKKGQLCSIPEDCPRFVLPRRPLEDEPICHRSPVSLANGYRPYILQRSKEILPAQNESLVCELVDEVQGGDPKSVHFVFCFQNLSC